MADRSELERLVGRAIFDDDFRVRLLNDPERTAESIGVKLTSEQVKYIHELSPEVRQGLGVLVREVKAGRTAQPTW